MELLLIYSVGAFLSCLSQLYVFETVKKKLVKSGYDLFEVEVKINKTAMFSALLVFIPVYNLVLPFSFLSQEKSIYKGIETELKEKTDLKKETKRKSTLIDSYEEILHVDDIKPPRAYERMTTREKIEYFERIRDYYAKQEQEEGSIGTKPRTYSIGKIKNNG